VAPWFPLNGPRAEMNATYGTAPTTYAFVYYSDVLCASRSRSFSLSRTKRDVAGQVDIEQGQYVSIGKHVSLICLK
jgi:hypothetical protein